MFFKNKNLTVKLFSAMFVLGLTIFIILLGANLNLTAKNIFTERKTSLNMNFTQSSQLITDMIKELEQTTKKIAINKDILFSGDKEKISRFLLQSYDIAPNAIQNLYFYYDGQIYSNKQVLLDIYGNEYLDSIVNSGYTPYITWGLPYTTLISQNTVPLSYCIGSREDYGVLIIDLNCSVIERHFESIYAANNMDYIIYSNSSGLPLRWNTDNLSPDNDTGTILHELEKLDFNTSTPPSFRFNGQNYSVFKSVPHQAFSFYVISPENTFEVLKPLIYTSTLTVIGVVLLLFFASYWIATKITAPINQFTKQLKLAYDKNRLPGTIENSYSGEVYEMVESYNDLAIRINSLVAEKEHTLIEKNNYEKQILQHQIGPHFLHNTLICIGSLANRNKKAEVVSTLNALLKLLSYSFDNSQELVPLKKEIESVTSFVQILQVRYDQIFELDIQMEESCPDYLVPKLILQPVVENAIYHGIIPKNTKGIITISAYKKAGYFYIDIKDNGIGMEEITEKIGQKSKKAERSYSIGLVNVIKRINLQYGSDSAVEISSCPSEGTTVQFRLPIES